MSQQPTPATPIVRHTRTQRTWTTREETYLRDHYRALDTATLAARLRRTYYSVETKIRQLGLHKRLLSCEQAVTGEYYTAARIAEGFGVPETTIRRWIRRGWLAEHARWITGADVAAFLRAHPEQVDPAHMTAEQRRWASALLDANENESERRATG